MNEKGEELSLEEYQRILREVKEDFDIRQIQLCITIKSSLMQPVKQAIVIIIILCSQTLPLTAVKTASYKASQITGFQPV